MKITTEQLRYIIKEELEAVMDESTIFGNIKKKKAYCKKNPSAAKCKKEDRPSPKNWKKATKDESLDEDFDKDRMECNKPRYLKKGETGYGEKQKVVKACKDGKEKIVKFGDADMENKSDNPDNKSNFRSRHNCADKKDKFKAGYWSCKDW